MLACLFISLGLILSVLIIFVAFSIEFANAVKSLKIAALQKKLLDLPSSNLPIIVSSNLMRFFCCSTNSLIPCSFIKYKLDKTFLDDGYEEDSFTCIYSSVLLNLGINHNQGHIHQLWDTALLGVY